jgi:DNA-binding SARP family transcriptional activator
MSSLKITLLGRFTIQEESRILAGFERAKVQELFSYLLLFRERPHPREALSTLLWDETAQARKYLRKALWHLQTALEKANGINGSGLLAADSDWIQLDKNADFWLDVANLERAFRLIQDVPGSELDDESAGILDKTVELYRGDLLENCYADWCLLERERYRLMFLAMLDKLMAYCEARQRYADGVSYGRLALRHDRARERTHRRIMRLYFLDGYRTDALRQYERCKSALQEELAVEPTLQTRRLFERICADDLARSSQSKQILPTSPSSTKELLAQLKDAQAILARIERQLRQGTTGTD